MILQKRHIALDRDEHPVFLAEGAWSLKAAQEMFPAIEFHFTSEFKSDRVATMAKSKEM